MCAGIMMNMISSYKRRGAAHFTFVLITLDVKPYFTYEYLIFDCFILPLINDYYPSSSIPNVVRHNSHDFMSIVFRPSI
jgi:hypothetical protein